MGFLSINFLAEYAMKNRCTPRKEYDRETLIPPRRDLFRLAEHRALRCTGSIAIDLHHILDWQ
jgi:hypothetical protein